jgi:hypothetical protein
MHALPPVPQSPRAVPAWQTPEASQQPVGQLVELHTQLPPTQVFPARQVTQAAPSVPHMAFVRPGSHVVPLQQPVEQSAAEQ